MIRLTIALAALAMLATIVPAKAQQQCTTTCTRVGTQTFCNTTCF